MFNKINRAFACVALIGLSLSTLVQADTIEDVLAAQPDDVQARYQYRNPQETLTFFGIEKGMTVIEALPGSGWYSKILLPVLGQQGKLVGVDYAQSMWSHFGFMTPERIESKKTWVDTWTTEAQGWRSENDASVAAFQFNSMPESVRGTADAVLFIRALHNLARFEETGQYLSSALSEAHSALKERGVVGVVQHAAREDRPDDWANGSNGYLKKSAVIAQFKLHGFELVKDSDINANPLDQANEGEFVWRLPPSLSGSKDDDAKKAAMLAIGESNRMTLLFKKISR